MARTSVRMALWFRTSHCLIHQAHNVIRLAYNGKLCRSLININSPVVYPTPHSSSLFQASGHSLIKSLSLSSLFEHHAFLHRPRRSLCCFRYHLSSTPRDQAERLCEFVFLAARAPCLNGVTHVSFAHSRLCPPLFDLHRPRFVQFQRHLLLVPQPAVCRRDHCLLRAKLFWF